MVTTTRALPLSSQSVAIATQDTHYSYSSRTRTAAVCDLSLLYEIYGSEGGDNPPGVKRTQRAFPRTAYKTSSASVLRCSGAANSCEYVVERLPLLIIFHEGFVQKTICKFGFHYKGCRPDSARLILRPENPSHFRIRIRYCERWPYHQLVHASNTSNNFPLKQKGLPNVVDSISLTAMIAVEMSNFHLQLFATATETSSSRK